MENRETTTNDSLLWKSAFNDLIFWFLTSQVKLNELCYAVIQLRFFFYNFIGKTKSKIEIICANVEDSQRSYAKKRRKNNNSITRANECAFIFCVSFYLLAFTNHKCALAANGMFGSDLSAYKRILLLRRVCNSAYLTINFTKVYAARQQHIIYTKWFWFGMLMFLKHKHPKNLFLHNKSWTFVH